MFKWYQNARVCYAYLHDVPVPGSAAQVQQAEDLDSTKLGAFRRSKWFTRGWTLQELLAPKLVVFFDAHWEKIGTKESLRAEIEEITGITDIKRFQYASVAQKMSWASKRYTTRMEDMAYCLMGLFGVNMPPLYGEGLRNAFLRLQLEILGMSDDESIFAWCWRGETSFQSPQILTGMLAGTPSFFKSSGDVHQTLFDENRPNYSMTNKGLAIELTLLPALPAEANPTGDLFFAPLNCSRQRDDKPIALLLQRRNGNNFARTFNLAPFEDFPYQGTITVGRKRVYIAKTGIVVVGDHMHRFEIDTGCPIGKKTAPG